MTETASEGSGSEGAPQSDATSLFAGPALYQPGSPWGPWAALGATLAVFVGQIVGVALVVIVLQVLAATGGLDTDLRPESVFSLGSPLGLSTMMASQVASIAIVWLLAGRGGRRPQVLQLNPAPKPALATYLKGGLLVLAATGLVEALLYGGLGFDVRSDTAWLLDGLLSPIWPGVVVMAVVLAPLWEELTFRGFLLSSLAATRLGFWGAALVVNLIWSSLHATYSVPGLISVFTAGLVLTWLLRRTGSIRVPIIAHGLANVAAVVFAYWAGQAT